ncbi:2-oxo-4-hydroxy-4-carboxy-5-ureidoimidazoline decarboxylase [Alteromonas sp. D210916BOD_24]|uniref:2-oxo-4-hydroxy-4-carboxy-5-ureidoimidazoline decarboxylase n=1 Tax=Alteromonas sp. D210916BOD_24 TaxID=3157618 RepID=UPI00399C94A4
MTLDELNNMDNASASTWFEQCCAAKSWIYHMVNARPYSSLELVEQEARSAWAKCSDADYLEAFQAHPMIGDIESLRKKFANTKAIAAGEQSGTADASETVLLQLKEANQAYVAKHGFIFIICATGLSAEKMLSELQHRLPHSTAQEIINASAEQLKITLLRINKALSTASCA